jgi:hypothetical protein
VLWASTQVQSPEPYDTAGAGTDEESKTPLDILSTEDLFRHLAQHPEVLASCEQMMTNILTGTKPAEKSEMTKSIFLNASLKSAVCMSSAPDDQMEDFHFYLMHIDPERLLGEENLASLKQEFMAEKFTQRRLGKIPDLQSTVRLGTGYLFARPEYASALSRLFEKQRLETLERVQLGVTDRIEDDDDSDEDIPKGYKSIDDFVTDQRRIISLPFHG